MTRLPPASSAGLSRTQAARQLARDGPNELPRPPRRTVWRILLEVVSEPMLQLMAGAVAIYWVLGDVAEAGVLLAFLGVIVAITLVQERRTERVLEALHDMTSPRAVVWRSGERLRVAGTELVCGDVIELAEGDRVPADAQLLRASDLAVDESLLSGESLPATKWMPLHGADSHLNAPAPATQIQVYAGTMVVAGQALARVTATGARSAIGRIGKVLGTIETQATPLHVQTRQLVRAFSLLGLAVSLAVGLLFAWTRGDWLGGALAGITLAMSMLPQEFLLILTVLMAMGAWRLSQHQVLTRRAATIEALGSATVLCTDKTGTLTQNRMALEALVRWEQGTLRVWRANDGALDPGFDDLLRHSVLASERQPVDPMERAIDQLARTRVAPPPADWQLVHEYSLSAQWPVMTHVWRAPGDTWHTVATKGAPESVVRLCRLLGAQREQVLAQARDLADQGMRVLAVAQARWPGTEWPVDQDSFHLRLIGLVAFADPLRTRAPDAVSDCRRAGIRVVMITGDHPGTALAIARQAGIACEGGVQLGTDVAAMDDLALQRCVATCSVFARVDPQQKLRIVEALKARGEVVAMTGDGVNDAPSLKAAHIGIAMGGRGTDVAREASSLVLLDDDFTRLVQAVRLGRRIFDNLRKAMRFVLAVHVPIAGLTLIPLALGWPLLFTPMHIAFLEIVINPVCSIFFEAEDEEPDVMDRPPRDPHAALFSLPMITHSLIQGGVALALVGYFFGALLHAGWGEAAARTAAFTALVAANLALILVNRSFGSGWRQLVRHRNRALWAMVLSTVLLLTAVIGITPLQSLFGFVVPSGSAIAAALGVGVAVLVTLLAHKRLEQVMGRAGATEFRR